MVLDYDNELTTAGAAGQVVTATAIGTKQLGSTTTARDWGAGEELEAYYRVAASFNTLTSLTITIEGADDAGLTTNAVVLATKTILLAALLINTGGAIGKLLAGFPRKVVGCRFTVGGSNPTLGSIKVGLRMRNAGQQGPSSFF